MEQNSRGRGITLALGILSLFGILFMISYSLTGNVIIETSNGNVSYLVDEDASFFYNITIENTNLLSTSNITKVSILFPDTFYFLTSSDGDDAGASIFSNTTTELIWENDGLIMNLTTNHFWFNLTATTPGDYELIVTVTNSTDSESFNVPVVVSDITAPLVEFTESTESDNSNITVSNIEITVAAVDNGIIDTIIIRLFNSESAEINSTSSSVSPLLVNFTGLSSGIYYFNSTVNDTYGNSNSTETRVINIALSLDTTSPIITLISPENSVSAVTDEYDFDFEVTDLSDILNCTLIFDDEVVEVLNSVTNAGATNTITYSSIGVGEHIWSIKCIDSELNIGSSSERYLEVTVAPTTETAVVSAEETTTVSAEETVVTAPENNIEITTETVVNENPSKRYQKEMVKDENLSIDVKDEVHTLNIKEITEENVVIIISSTPQEATFLIGEEKKFDVSEDGYYDLVVKLNFIDYTDTNSPKANFTIDTINEKIEATVEVINDTVEEPTIEDEEEFNIVWVIIPALILLIIGAAVWDKINSRKNKKKYKK